MEAHYNVLGICVGASLDEIKKARNRMALKYHPDKNQDNVEHSTEQMKLINEAYEILSKQTATNVLNNLFRRRHHPRRQNGNDRATLHAIALEQFKTEVKSCFGNAKTKCVSIKRSHRLSKTFHSFSHLIRECQELTTRLTDADCCPDKQTKEYVKILLDEMNELMNDPNNVIWFKQLCLDGGLKWWYEVYVRHGIRPITIMSSSGRLIIMSSSGRLNGLWCQMLKYGVGFKL